MTNEALKLYYRMTIQLIGGDYEQFEKLRDEAIKIHYECVCPECGGLTNPGIKRIGKKKVKIEFCTSCGHGLDKYVC